MYIVLQTPYLAPNLNTENLRVNTTLLPRLPRRSIETALCHSWWDLEVQRVKEGGWKVQCLFSACCPSIDHRGECTVNYGWCSAALTCALFIVVALYVVKLADRLPCYSKKKLLGFIMDVPSLPTQAPLRIVCKLPNAVNGKKIHIILLASCLSVWGRHLQRFYLKWRKVNFFPRFPTCGKMKIVI